jgi:ribonuclease P protein component
MMDNVASSSDNNRPATATFPRHARLRNPQQFQDTFSQGRRINAPLFRLHVRFSPLEPDESGCARVNPNHACARLGIAVSKRVDAHAVGRSRIKRVARESFRSIRMRLPIGDYVLLAQREAARADNTQLAQALDTLWVRAAALATTDNISSSEPASSSAPLKPGSAAVTMPARELTAAKPGYTPELP